MIIHCHGYEQMSSAKKQAVIEMCRLGHDHFLSPEHGPDSPTNGRVSGASGCSGTRSGPNNRAALTAKPRIQARVAGLNVRVQATAHGQYDIRL